MAQTNFITVRTEVTFFKLIFFQEDQKHSVRGEFLKINYLNCSWQLSSSETAWSAAVLHFEGFKD